MKLRVAFAALGLSTVSLVAFAAAQAPSPPPSSAAPATAPAKTAPATAGAPAAGAPTDSGPAPADVLSKLHHANQMEIEAGKLAQQKGHSKGVKDFGKQLVKDHTAANKKVASAAKQLKVELPTDAAPMKHDKLEQTRALTGPDFDRAFVTSMLEDHQQDVAEASDARDRTTNPTLKKLLTDLVPTLEKHRATAEKLASATEPAPAK
jgi:putative membrane protein